MTNWSVSIRIFAKAGFLSIYLSARRHSTSCDGVRKGEPAARVRVHSGGRLRGSLRKVDCSTDDDAESNPMSKQELELRKPRRMSYARDLEML
jgi:hypothetical protein